jgi:predicted acylesterase/phospholipase RssA
VLEPSTLISPDSLTGASVGASVGAFVAALPPFEPVFVSLFAPFPHAAANTSIAAIAKVAIPLIPLLFTNSTTPRINF